jgi:putative transposase
MGRRSSQEWQTIIEQQETSGLSVADFCQQQQFDYKYFQARKRALLKRQQRKPTTSFIKLSKPIPNTALISLQFGESTLSLPANTEPDWLAQLFKALSA